MAEAEPCRPVVGLGDQVAAKKLDGRCILPGALMGSGHAEQRVGGGSNVKCAPEGGLGVSAIAALQVSVTELDGEIRHHRRSLDGKAQRFGSLRIAFHGVQKTAELAERRHIGWRPLGGTLEPRQRVLIAADLAQGHRQLGIDLRVMAAARDRFQQRNGILGAALNQQGATEDLQRLRLLRDGLEHVPGDPLGFVGTMVVQSEHRPLQQVVAAAHADRHSGKSRSVRHHQPVRSAARADRKISTRAMPRSRWPRISRPFAAVTAAPRFC